MASPSPDADEPVPLPASFLQLPGYRAGWSDSRVPLEFGGDRIEIPLGRIDLPAREQTVQSGASCSYGVSLCAGRESGRHKAGYVRNPGRLAGWAATVRRDLYTPSARVATGSLSDSQRAYSRGGIRVGAFVY
jgi:hypothetical protein